MNLVISESNEELDDDGVCVKQVSEGAEIIKKTEMQVLYVARPRAARKEDSGIISAIGHRPSATHRRAEGLSQRQAASTINNQQTVRVLVAYLVNSF